MSITERNSIEDEEVVSPATQKIMVAIDAVHNQENVPNRQMTSPRRRSTRNEATSSRRSTRQRAAPPSPKSSSPVPSSPAPAPAPAAASSSCLDRVCGTILLLALVVMAALVALLLVALVTSGVPLPPAFGVGLLAVDPPCAAPEPEMLALPPPPCKFHWLRFRCSYGCELKMRWRPLPRPKCMLIPYVAPEDDFMFDDNFDEF